MLKLHLIQAAHGDALLLAYANPAKYILIDGGPESTFQQSLGPEIKRVVGTKTLEALIISHVDMDHISGVLDLLTELKREKDAEESPSLRIKAIWLNSFQKTLDQNGEIQKNASEIFVQGKAAAVNMNATGFTLNGIKEGFQVGRKAVLLDIPQNIHAAGGVFIASEEGAEIDLEGLKLTILGPSQKRLDKLKTKWLKWIEENQEKIDSGKFDAMAMSDNSVPNLSSIMFLMSYNQKSILFAGDGRGDHLIEGLKLKGLLSGGKIHVDVFKVPHHGSARNNNAALYDTITADQYVISADGTNGNPDLDTLKWITEAAKKQARQIKIVVTNETPTTKKLVETYPPADWGYTIEYIPVGGKSLEIQID